MVRPWRLRAVFLWSINNRSVLQSIQLQWQDESVQSDRQRISDFWLICCNNDQLLVARLDFHTKPPAAQVRVMGLTVKTRPPVVEERSSERQRQEEDGLLSPSGHWAFCFFSFLSFPNLTHRLSSLLSSEFSSPTRSLRTFSLGFDALETNSSVCVVLSRALFSNVPVAACCSAFSLLLFLLFVIKTQQNVQSLSFEVLTISLKTVWYSVVLQ